MEFYIMSNTNIGGTFSISVDSVDATIPEVANTTLDETAFGALTWQAVPNMGTHGDTGVDQNMVSFPTWDNLLTVQQKGAAIGKTYEVIFLDQASDGMTALQAASAIDNNNNFAFKLQWPDGRIEYGRGVVSAPGYSKGSNEDFATVAFNIAANQPIVQSAV